MIPLCDQTVTVYRKKERFVVENCFYRHTQVLEESDLGKRQDGQFLLVVAPGDYVPQVGDKVLPGIGPETENGEQLLPCTAEGLGQIAYVTPWYLGGTLHHYEAGKK